jgi:hypothetical protein
VFTGVDHSIVQEYRPTDRLVDLLIQVVHKISVRAEKRVEKRTRGGA